MYKSVELLILGLGTNTLCYVFFAVTLQPQKISMVLTDKETTVALDADGRVSRHE